MEKVRNGAQKSIRKVEKHNFISYADAIVLYYKREKSSNGLW